MSKRGDGAINCKLLEFKLEDYQIVIELYKLHFFVFQNFSIT
jgi:hypothetical protein